MKKTIILTIIVVTIPFLVWQTWLIVGGFIGNGEAEHKLNSQEAEKAFMQDSIRIAHFIKKGKSPFLPYKIKPKPKKAKKKAAPVKRKPKVAVKPPRIKVTGIMWNPTNPVAMVTLPNGTNTVARSGNTLTGGIEVKKVEKNRIQVVYKGNSFWINR